MLTRYLWDPMSDNILSEVGSNGSTTVEYTWEPTVHGALVSENRAGNISQYHVDGMRNTVALTSATQQITDTYDYTAFGDVISSTGLSSIPYQYKGGYGYYGDPQTETISVRMRHLSTSLARWLSRDPVNLQTDFSDLYRYANNSPISFADPSGLGAHGISVQMLRKKEKCGDRSLLWLFFVLDNPAPCVGNFFQKVEVYLRTYTKCNGCVLTPPKNIKYDYCYYESFGIVRQNATVWAPEQDGITDHTDEMGANTNTGECGLAIQHRELRFYCLKDTGDVGQPGTKPKKDNPPWGIGNVADARTLPSANCNDFPNGEPPFWKIKPKASFKYILMLKWCCYRRASCCPGKARVVRFSNPTRL